MSQGQTDPQYKLRLPADLKAKIEQSAEKLNRTINADIVARLTDSFEREDQVAASFEPVAWLKDLSKRGYEAEKEKDLVALEKVCADVERAQNVSKGIKELAATTAFLIDVYREGKEPKALEEVWSVGWLLADDLHDRLRDVQKHYAKQAEKLLKEGGLDPIDLV